MVVRRYRGTEMVVAVVHARNSFRMCTYKKSSHKSFRMRSYKIIGLKVPWNHTLPKRRGRGVVRQRSASLPLLRVAAEEPVPADGEHFAKHAQAVAEDVNLGLWVVRPTHRNFDGAQAMAFGEEKDFGVEAEALDALLLKDDARVFADEGFKAALRVGEIQPGDRADDGIENLAGKLAQRRLVNFDQAGIHAARADCDFVATQRGEQLIGLLDRRGQVSIGEQHDPPAGFEHAVAHAVAFAAVAAVREQPQAGEFRAPLFHNSRTAVARAIVHDDHFRAGGAGTQILSNTPQGFGEAPFFIVGRGEDGKFWGGLGHSGFWFSPPEPPPSGPKR